MEYVYLQGWEVCVTCTAIIVYLLFFYSNNLVIILQYYIFFIMIFSFNDFIVLKFKYLYKYNHINHKYIIQSQVQSI